ncbi:putative DNA repair protein RAD51 [Klebsormidium nitens]|uniref:Putative DNA repair protein RAD51 n=1 Tax=Klebsormidium nitens TaxID=105231 RepID=A0A1Y1ICX6_KLENI|nr:putative DNA repair protein RAD51 [Klebsormidium nitens]|eukprot:GAQ85938.1 putative DNA repair protein RAD51 [Klebsormidium nitens]
MGSKEISRLNIEGLVAHRLKSRRLETAKDVLCKTELDLVELLDLPADVVAKAVAAISQNVAPTRRTVLEMYMDQQQPGDIQGGHLHTDLPKLPTNLPSLDDALRGGVPLGSITELVGPAGVGKTQLCLMLSIFATLPTDIGGLDGKCVYIDTENKFSAKRLIEIATMRLPDSFPDEQAVQHLTSRVLVLRPNSAIDLLTRLQKLEEAMIREKAKLIVLDSVAALVRSEYGHDQLQQRQDLLGRQAALLKYLAETFRIPVVVTNQVMAQMGAPSQQPNYGFVEHERKKLRPSPGYEDSTYDSSTVTAALGTKWAHAVNTRLVLERHAGQRYIRIAKSPMAPSLAFPYAIAAGGLYLSSSEVHDASAGGGTSILNEGSVTHSKPDDRFLMDVG